MKLRTLLYCSLLFSMLALIILALQPPIPVRAASSFQCRPVKQIVNLQGEPRLSSAGLHVDRAGSGEVTFQGRGQAAYASLSLTVDPSGEYSAARITEVDTSHAPEQRTLCWQPTDRKNVVAEFDVRFAQPDTPPGLTETLVLWNAPLGGDTPLPLTAIGVSRNQSFPGYNATLSQNLTFFPEFSGIIHMAPMPEWLDPTEWHAVRITVGVYDVRIEAAQGTEGYVTVLEATTQEAIEPLAFEYSIDNEILPGLTHPVTVPDTLKIDSLSIRYVNNHRP